MQSAALKAKHQSCAGSKSHDVSPAHVHDFLRVNLPSSTLYGLNYEEKVRRAEMFAMASLFYEIMSGREPFEGLTDNEVQHHFINGDFRDDAAALPNSPFILSGWSEE